MRMIRSLFCGAVAVFLLTFLPAGAAAEQEVPICHPTQSSTICYYVYDPGDCFVDPDTNIRYCRTLAFYRWET